MGAPAAGEGLLASGNPCGTDWADVGLATVEFARSEFLTFVLVVGSLLILTVAAICLCKLMLPRSERDLMRVLRDRGRNHGDNPEE